MTVATRTIGRRLKERSVQIGDRYLRIAAFGARLRKTDHPNSAAWRGTSARVPLCDDVLGLGA